MRLSKNILSLAMASAVAVNSCPFAVYSADVDDELNWSYSICYDSEGNRVAKDLSYWGSAPDIYVPEKIQGYPVVNVDGWQLMIENTYDEVTIHIPDSVEFDNEESLNYLYHISKINVEWSSGKTKVYYPKMSLDTPLYDDAPVEEKWEYRILDGIEGVYDGPCVELLKYKDTDVNNIECPLELEGYPVARIGGKIFEDIKGTSPCKFTMPESVVEYAFTYEEPSGYMFENNGSVSFPKIQLTDGCFDYKSDLTVELCEYNFFVQAEDMPEGIVDKYGKHYDDRSWTSEHSRHSVNYYLEQNDCDSENKWWSVRKMTDTKGETFRIADYIAGYPVRGIFTGSEGECTSTEAVDVILPDTIDLIEPFAFSEIQIRNINIPEGVEVLPPCCFGLYYDMWEIKGIENVPIVSNRLFIDNYLDTYTYYDKWMLDANWDYYMSQWESLVNRRDLVFFNYSHHPVYYKEIFKPFMITDENTGYTYEAKIGKEDHKLSLTLIYMPDPNDEIPKEYKGFPVKVDLRDLKPLGAKVVIPENVTDFTKDDMKYYMKQRSKAELDYFFVGDETFESMQEEESDIQSTLTKDVQIKSRNIHIGTKAFRSANLKEIEFPGSAVIDRGAFDGNTRLEKVKFSGEDADITLNDSAFLRLLNINEIIFPEKCHDLNIGKNAFSQNRCKYLTLPEGTSYVGAYAFNRSMLEEITINGSPDIDDFAFNGCIGLKKITINGEPKIGEKAFNNCTDIEELDVDLTKPINGAIFTDSPKLMNINGESVFDENGVPKEKFVDYVEKNFGNADEVGFVNKYVQYRVRNIVNETINSDMTDIEKVKALHDKICSMVEYDTDNIADKKNHTDISIFVNDSSVCEGYARAMDLMLREAGFSSFYVYSEDHAWVVVRVGDHYFHVDPTWDDGDVVNYDWFMKNDDEIKTKDSHHEWALGIPSSLHSTSGAGLPKCTERMGDVNTDGAVDGRDASLILTAYAQASLGDEMDIDTVLADVDFNGNIDARDASAVLTEYTRSSAT